MLTSFKWYRRLLGGTWYKVKRVYWINEETQQKYNHPENIVINFWTRKPQCDTIIDTEVYEKS